MNPTDSKSSQLHHPLKHLLNLTLMRNQKDLPVLLFDGVKRLHDLVTYSLSYKLKILSTTKKYTPLSQPILINQLSRNILMQYRVKKRLVRHPLL